MPARSYKLPNFGSNIMLNYALPSRWHTCYIIANWPRACLCLPPLPPRAACIWIFRIYTNTQCEPTHNCIELNVSNRETRLSTFHSDQTQPRSLSVAALLMPPPHCTHTHTHNALSPLHHRPRTARTRRHWHIILKASDIYIMLYIRCIHAHNNIYVYIIQPASRLYI